MTFHPEETTQCAHGFETFLHRSKGGSCRCEVRWEGTDRGVYFLLLPPSQSRHNDTELQAVTWSLTDPILEDYISVFCHLHLYCPCWFEDTRAILIGSLDELKWNGTNLLSTVRSTCGINFYLKPTRGERANPVPKLKPH